MSEPETSVPPPEAAAPAEPSAAQPAYQSASRTSPAGYVFFAGLFLLLSGIAWIWVEPETGVFSKVWIFASLLMMLVPLAWHGVDFIKAVASRRGAAFGFVVITLALGFVVTGFVGWAAVTYRQKLPNIDLTKTSRYSLSDESVKLLAKVEGTVYATYLVQGRTDPGLRADALEQLRVYEASSSHVKVTEVDALRSPDAAARALREAGVGATSSGEDADLVVLTYAEAGKEVTPGKQKEIKIETWAFTKMSSTGEAKWLGEGVYSSGIFELVFQKYKAYATGGHGERALGEEFHELKGALTTQNIEVVSTPLMLSTSAMVPDDCELLLVLAPTAPFTPDEAAAVSRWLDKGKTLVLTVDVADERFQTGLDELLDKFGVATRANYEVVAPMLGRHMIDGREAEVLKGLSNQFPVYGDAYADHAAASALRTRGGLATYFVKSTYLEVDEKPPLGASPEVVCYAPDRKEQNASPVALNHYKGRTNFQSFMADKDREGVKFPLVATSTRTLKDMPDRDARLILSGDTDVFTDRVISQYPANLDLARGLVQWGLRREGLVAVSARTLEDPYVTPTEYQRRFALVWPLFACFLPLLVGGLVWWTRRR
jgi:hypothetical protein